MPRPLRRDPTRTTSIQLRFAREIRSELSKLRKSINNLIVEEDAFGLKPVQRLNLNTRFAFETDAGKVQAFNAWLQEQVDAGILTIDASGYVSSAYKSAAIRSYIAANAKLSGRSGFFSGTQADFLLSLIHI